MTKTIMLPIIILILSACYATNYSAGEPQPSGVITVSMLGIPIEKPAEDGKCTKYCLSCETCGDKDAKEVCYIDVKESMGCYCNGH